MITLEEFIHAIINALGGKSAAPVAREAGLPTSVISHLKKRHDPGLERAAKIADAVGLELHLRYKGEIFDTRLLHLAIEKMRSPQGGYVWRDDEDAHDLARMLNQAARTYAGLLSPSMTSDPDKTAYALLRSMKLDAQRLIEHMKEREAGWPARDIPVDEDGVEIVEGDPNPQDEE